MNEEVYLHRNLSAQECDSDDLEGEMNLSDDEQLVEKRYKIKFERKKERKQFNLGKANKYHVEVDTNVFEVALDCLKNNAELATGDAEFCKECQAVFNYKSQLQQLDNDQIWQCEFCNHRNSMMLDDEEKPKTEAVNYLIEAAAQVEDKKLAGQDVSVIFCLDVSGSMCVSEPVKGKH